MNRLYAEIEVSVRFSEVDSMGIVWHGNYALYFEEAREAFGRKYGLGYLSMFGRGYYAPLVELNFGYKRPLVYGDRVVVRVEYVPTESAKIIFDYTIVSAKDGSIAATGRSVQVFLDKEYALQWTNPKFYDEWKKEHLCE